MFVQEPSQEYEDYTFADIIRPYSQHSQTLAITTSHQVSPKHHSNAISQSKRRKAEGDDVIVDANGVIYIDCTPNSSELSFEDQSSITIPTTNTSPPTTPKKRRKLAEKRQKTPEVDWDERPMFQDETLEAFDGKILKWMNGHGVLPDLPENDNLSNLDRPQRASSKPRDFARLSQGTYVETVAIITDEPNPFQDFKPKNRKPWEAIRELVQTELDVGIDSGRSSVEILKDAKKQLEQLNGEVGELLEKEERKAERKMDDLGREKERWRGTRMARRGGRGGRKR